jgi:predicted nucleic acid-binding protein
MIVVSNTSPLTNLAAIGQFDLLHRLYARLYIAEGVWDELNAQGKHWPGRDEVAAADCVRTWMPCVRPPDSTSVSHSIDMHWS